MRAAKIKKSHPSEHQEQATFVAWFRAQYPKRVIVAIPNGSVLGGDARLRAIRSRKLKDEGMLPGTADLFIAWPRGCWHGLWIEAKSMTGAASKEQLIFGADVKREGYAFEVCKGFEAMKQAVLDYLMQSA